jgi:hypothetical protein
MKTPKIDRMDTIFEDYVVDDNKSPEVAISIVPNNVIDYDEIEINKQYDDLIFKIV